MINKDNKILIVGLGLIGGSYAEGLTANGYEVGAIDTNIDSIDYAIKSIIKKSHLTKKIRNTKILAIDEISMLDAQTFDYINNLLKEGYKEEYYTMSVVEPIGK